MLVRKRCPKGKYFLNWYMRIFVTFLLLLLFYIGNVKAQQVDSLNQTYYYTLKELSELEISTGSIKSENAEKAPSNIHVITSQMIEERGYQTLVDICQDIPGFDFMMYNDGGGEYPTYNMLRGIGEIGNPEVLILIDGIVQNHSSFNWSMLWTYDNLLIDIDRIEIIQGPGSVMYGAQAFSGVINLISKKNSSGIHVKSFFGSNQTYGSDISLGSQIGEDANISLAFHKYTSNGDYGIGRYDPGGYFKDNLYPLSTLANYDSAGNYIENSPNPKGGLQIPDGFNTQNDNFVVRTKIAYKNTEIGFFISDKLNGYASANVAYEYNISDRQNKSHYQSYYTYLKNRWSLNQKLNLTSNIVFRATKIIPDVGFKYLFRFPELNKTYASYSPQWYIEENLSYELNQNNVLSIGIKGALSKKSERIVSLGALPSSKTTASSSWDIAEKGDGLNIPKEYPVILVKEAAIFLLWDKQWVNNLSSSAGLRYDYSSEYGSILNPRIAIDYTPSPAFGIKLMYGSAFRQPSIFELTSEFRGNPDLKPQTIQTYEMEYNSLLFNKRVSMKLNLFASNINMFIGKVEDVNMPAGERYVNIDNKTISGLSYYLSYQVFESILLYSNYGYLIGFNVDSNLFYEIDRVAKHKINAGINYKFFNRKATADFRLNYVGKRKAPLTNKWLYTYQNGYAPNYLKANLCLTYYFNTKIAVQVVVNNVFNKKFYGIGRETGSGFIDEYDYQNQINPNGHIPAYHPQPGRTFLFNLIFKLDNNE